MKYVKVAVCLAIAFSLLAGCAMPQMVANFTREVTIEKDGSGATTKTVIIETASQNYITTRIWFSHVTPKQNNDNFPGHMDRRIPGK